MASIADDTGGAGDSAPGGVRQLFAWLLRVVIACAVCGVVMFVASIVIMAAGLIFSSDERIEDSLIEAHQRGVLIGRVISPTAGFEPSPYGHIQHAYDMWTECLSFSVNLGNADDGLLRRIAATPTITRDGDAIDADTCRILYEELSAGTMRADEPYLRFWHGYTAYMRPVLTVMSVENLRRLTAVIFYGVMIFFAWRLSRWLGMAAWPIALTPFFLVGDFLTVPIVTSHAISLAMVFLSVGLFQLIDERIPDARTLILPAFVFSAGMATSFVSWLFNPPLAAALIGFLAIAGALLKGRRDLGREAGYAGLLIFLWFAGYFAEWIAKWVFAAAVLGPTTVLDDVLGRIAHYEAEGEAVQTGLLEVLARNFAPNGKFAAYIGVAVAAAFAAVGALAVLRRISRTDLLAYLVMLAPLLAVLLWVAANPGHSFIHAGYVSRSFLLFAVIPPLAALLTWKLAAPKAKA